MVINKTYRRKTFTVQAIQVTAENIQGLAEWCDGKVVIYWPDISRQSVDYRAGQTCVEVVIGRVNGRVQKARAYPGDWITRLHDTNNFRVYRNKTFLEAFEEVRSEIEKREAVSELVYEALRQQDNATQFHDDREMPGVLRDAVDKIMEVFA